MGDLLAESWNALTGNNSAPAEAFVVDDDDVSMESDSEPSDGESLGDSEDDDEDDEDEDEDEDEDSELSDTDDGGSPPPPPAFRSRRNNGPSARALAGKERLLSAMRPRRGAGQKRAAPVDMRHVPFPNAVMSSFLIPPVTDECYGTISESDALEMLSGVVENELTRPDAINDPNWKSKVTVGTCIYRVLCGAKKPRDTVNLRGFARSAVSGVLDANKPRGPAAVLVACLEKAVSLAYVGGSGEVPHRLAAEADGICVATGSEVKKGEPCYYVQLVDESGRATRLMVAPNAKKSVANVEVVAYMYALLHIDLFLEAVRARLLEIDPKLFDAGCIFPWAMAAKLVVTVCAMSLACAKAFVPAK